MQKERLRAYKYRLYPEEHHFELLHKHFGCVRFIYNWAFSTMQKHYEETGESLSKYDVYKLLTHLKKEPEYEWLSEVSTRALRGGIDGIVSAYTAFFKSNAQFPKYKSKHKSKLSFIADGTVRIENGRLRIAKFKDGIPVKQHRHFEGEIRSVTVSMHGSGRYYASVLVKERYTPLPHPGDKRVGIDLGIRKLAVDSEGNVYENGRYYQNTLKKLKTAQRHLSRKEKGSHRYYKQKVKVARLHEQVVNQRRNALHNLSIALVKNNSVIAAETLEVKKLMQVKWLAQKLSDASWGELLRQLAYKAEWHDREFIQVAQEFPSSQVCSNCGYQNTDLRFSSIRWTCPSCGTEHDRDHNAAKNVLEEALKIRKTKEKVCA